MKNIVAVCGVLALAFVLPYSVGAAKAETEPVGNQPDTAGDGIKNSTQDEEYGDYGDGEATNELSGDGVPNAQQDEEYGGYGADTAPASAPQYKGEGVPQLMESEQVQAQNKGEAQQLQVRHTAQNADELDDVIKQVRQEVRVAHDEEQGTRAEVRLQREDAEVALRAMVAAGPILGTAQQKMQQLAQQAATNHEQALVAQVRMEDRSGFARFFGGGDDAAADELEQLSAQNRETIRTMMQLVEDCDSCDAAARKTLREQVRAMEDEEDRLTEVIAKERDSKGLFGFLFGWLG